MYVMYVMCTEERERDRERGMQCNRRCNVRSLTGHARDLPGHEAVVFYIGKSAASKICPNITNNQTNSERDQLLQGSLLLNVHVWDTNKEVT